MPSHKPMVKISAPWNVDGMLPRNTFDVPATNGGAKFMQWWGKAAADARAEVLKYANDNHLGVVEALEKVQCDR